MTCWSTSEYGHSGYYQQNDTLFCSTVLRHLTLILSQCWIRPVGTSAQYRIRWGRYCALIRVRKGRESLFVTMTGRRTQKAYPFSNLNSLICVKMRRRQYRIGAKFHIKRCWMFLMSVLLESGSLRCLISVSGIAEVFTRTRF